ncbi:reverse transcriptase domain-containing protein [Tanacetum coccineum]
MNFVVVRSPSPYNGIIGRPGVRKLQAVPSTAHEMLKLQVEGGLIILQSSRMVPLECATVSGPKGNLPATKQTMEERIKVAINPKYPEQTIMIGSTLTKEGRNKLCDLLQRNLDIFAWKPADLTDAPRHIAEHRFKCARGMFSDAYKGCHQIQMAKEDEEKIAFITSQGIFCYIKMPFGLRNARATYQRLVDKAFHKQIGRNLKVYVDDLVIKSRTEDEIVRDIEETFKTLREINMKLNPKNSTFGVEEGMFLGYKVNTRGLKLCPNKVDTVLSLPSPKCLKDVQKLNGKLASLNRFLSKSAEKSLPFFKTLKKRTKKSDFHWTAEAEEAFKQMKQLIAELLMLAAPMEKEELIIYLAAAKETVSAVLMTEREAKQLAIYFVSRALRGLEINYTSMEKLVLALVHAKEESPNTLMEVEEELPEPWILFTDESSFIDGFGAGLYHKPRRDGIHLCPKIQVRTLTSSFKVFSIRQISRSENKKADALSKIASTSFAHLSKQVLVEKRKEKLISEVEILAVVEEERDTWMTPIFEYLTEETLPAYVKKARAFRDNPFKDWCEKLCIRQHFASVKHPQTNGLVERANRSLGEGIKARLGEKNKNRLEELSHVLWAHRTMIKSSNAETPFLLTYGTEAVIPAEIGMPILRTTEVNLVQNNKALEINLDLLEEKREQAAIREAKSKAKMEKYYNSKVQSTSFKLGDLVYHNNDASRVEDT